MNYRERSPSRKEITLPSGAVIQIKKLNAYATPALAKRVADDEASYGARLSIYILTDRTGPLEGLKIVEKVADEATEIAIEELDQADAEAIVSGVMEFSGLTKRAEEARATFPEAGQTNGHQCAPSGNALPGPSSDGSPEAPAGRVASTA